MEKAYTAVLHTAGTDGRNGRSEAVSGYLSGKIRFLSALSMVFVVFIHAYNYTDTFLQPTTCITEGLHLGAMTQFFLSNAFLRSAVPLYFIISGFLFFARRELTPEVYARQIRRRAKSVLLVFLIVSTASFAGCSAIYAATGPGVFPVIDERMEVVEQGLAGALKIWLNNPFAFQLWFLMQLFLICLFAPVINSGVRRFGVLLPILLTVLWAFDLSLDLGSFRIFNADTYLFFTVGAYLGIKKVRLPGMDEPAGSKPTAWMLIGMLAALSAAYTLLCASLKESGTEQLVLYKLVSIVGIAAIWYLYDLIPERFSNSRCWKALERHSFMVFLLHEPLMHMLYSRGLSLSGADEVHMLLYFGLPLLMILLMGAVGSLLKKYCLPLHRLLTGDR